MAFVIIHTSVGRAACRYGSPLVHGRFGPWMYEPHEAREDTVVFPALRDVVPAKEFRDLAETFEYEEHRRFGQAGFQGVVDKVADIEKSLGIYDLCQFTPT